MYTKIDLCSMALLKLGESPIQSLMADVPSAQLARTLFDAILDALLCVHPWRFACRDTDLIKNADGEFQIPSECLRVIQASGDIIGDKIHAPSNRITIRSIVRVPPESLPEYFIPVLVSKLAMEFCIPLIGEQNIFSMLAALYETELQTAKFIDSTSAPNHSRIETFSLINARF